MEEETIYLDNSGLGDAISEVWTTILRERPENPIHRFAELLAEYEKQMRKHKSSRNTSAEGAREEADAAEGEEA